RQAPARSRRVALHGAAAGVRSRGADGGSRASRGADPEGQVGRELATGARRMARPSPAASVALVGLAVLSLALRLLFWSGTEVQETLRADAHHYTYLAWSLANRGLYEDTTDPTFQAHLRWPPGYPALLAPLFRDRTQIDGAAVAQEVQVVAGSVIPVLVVLVGLRFL